MKKKRKEKIDFPSFELKGLDQTMKETQYTELYGQLFPLTFGLAAL